MSILTPANSFPHRNFLSVISKSVIALVFLSSLCASLSAAATDPSTSGTLDKWQQLFVDRVAVFRAENAKLKPTDRPIVFAGDSLTQHMRVGELFPGKLVLNRGIGSDGTADLPNSTPPHYRGLVNRYEDSILNARPRVLFILMGTNDVGRRNIELSYWEKHLEALIARVAKDLPDCQIVLQTLPPSGPPYARVENLNTRAREYNEILKKLAARKNLPIIDLWAIYASPEGILPPDLTNDGLHLKREAYERWAAAARPHFRPAITGPVASPGK
jgi:lysophospholipase L1-like esterase